MKTTPLPHSTIDAGNPPGPAMPTKAPAQPTGSGLVATVDTVPSSDAAHDLSSGATKQGDRQ